MNFPWLTSSANPFLHDSLLIYRLRFCHVLGELGRADRLDTPTLVPEILISGTADR